MKFQAKNKNFASVIAQKLEKQHFMHHIGFKLTKIEEGCVEGELFLELHHQQQLGYLHGGVTATVADLVMGFAAYTLVSENESTVTSDLKIAYLNPGIGNKVKAIGKVIKAGNLLYFCEADILVENSEGISILVARGYSTMCAIRIN